MEQVATVARVEQGKAIVRVKRTSACSGECHTCSGCETPSVEAEAANPLGAEPGDMVVVDTPASKVLFGAFLLYIVPLFTMFAGYYFFKLFGAILGFLAPYLIFHQITKNFVKLTIVKVIEK